MTDEQLMQRFASGDHDAFDTLVERYKRPLFTVIYRMTGNRADAEDIFQETLMRIVRHKKAFDPDKTFSSWVYAIATNLCRDRARKLKNRSAGELDEERLASDRDPETDSFRAEISAAMEKAILLLPEEQREVFLLREYAGLPFSRIAEATGSKLNTVLGRMHLAIRKLRTELSEFEEWAR